MSLSFPIFSACSVFLSSCLSVIFLCPLSLSLHFSYFLSHLLSSPFSLYLPLPSLHCSFPYLLSPPLSLLPLFRLCKVQLGFGACGLQAWREEDALSEYALLGSLCVTLYFFALPVLLFSFYSCICQVMVFLSSCGFPSLMEEDPLLLVLPVSCRKLVSQKNSFLGISRKHLCSQMELAEHAGLYIYILSHFSHCNS